jgi:excisionase family DNA binding protein
MILLLAVLAVLAHPGPDLFDVAGAADYLHTTERHVRGLWWKGCIGGHKLGKKIRFTRADLDAYLEATRRPMAVGE